jgi:hypothetical protein
MGSFFVLALIAFGAIAAAWQAWHTGDFARAAGPLLVLALVAFSSWRRSRDRR